MADENPYICSGVPIYPPPVGADYGDPKAWAAMMQWQFIWLRTIAKVWEEAATLPEKDREFTNKLIDPDTDLHDFFCEYFGYGLNPHLKLKVVLSEHPLNATELDAGKNWFTKGHKNRGKTGLNEEQYEFPLELTIRIPKAPALAEQAFDLATYADSGRTYPFTCC